MNKVILCGRLGQDPELRRTPQGKSVCTLSLATKKQDKAEWHKVVLWEKNAENAEKYLKKGSQIIVEGRLEYQEWEKDGVKRTTAQVVGFSMYFVGDNKGGASTKPEPMPSIANRASSDFDGDDVPF